MQLALVNREEGECGKGHKEEHVEAEALRAWLCVSESLQGTVLGRSFLVASVPHAASGRRIREAIWSGMSVRGTENRVFKG